METLLISRSNLESTKEVVFQSNLAPSEDKVGDVAEDRDSVNANFYRLAMGATL